MPLAKDELIAANRGAEIFRQDLTAECMAQKGFEYEGWVDPAFDLLPEEIAELSPEELLRLDGFQVSLLAELELNIPLEPPQSDPNIAQYDSLTEAGRKQWDVAYYGFDPSDPDAPEFIDNTGFGSTEGCLGLAAQSLLPDNPATEAELNAYFELVNSVEEAIEADTRVIAADEAFSLCLRNAGYDADSTDAMIQLTAQMASAITGVELELIDPVYLKEWAKESSGNAKRLAEAQEFEGAAALKTWACLERTEDLRVEVRAELEQELVDQNFELLLAVKPHLIQNRPLLSGG